jgi:hypothetical protein
MSVTHRASTRQRSEGLTAVSDCTWTGGDSSFHWAASKNWSPGVPTEDDDVVIPARAPYNQPEPPAGTRVHALRLEGGGLAARLAVSDRFEWLGGTLQAGLDLGTAKLIVTGDGGQSSRSDITSANTTLRNAVIGLSQGARFLNTGTLSSSGTSRLWWVASQNPFFVNRGTVDVADGTLSIDDVIGLLGSRLQIQPGATLRIRSQTTPSFLLDGAVVSGGGTLQVGGGGRLYAVRTARVAAGTTIELARDGSIEDARAATLSKDIVGPIAGTQTLTVDGRLLWTGGAVYGDVTLGAQGVLQVEGADLRQHMGGTIRLAGSGALTGPARMETWNATLRNDGDLVLRSDAEISASRTYAIDNRGALRTSGSGTVRLQVDVVLTNRRTVELTEGTMVLAGTYQPLPAIGPRPADAPRAGRLTVRRGATLRVASDLAIDQGSLGGAGTVTLTSPGGVLRVGHGRSRADLELGAEPDRGRLTVEGACRLGARARLSTRIPAAGTTGAQHGELQVSGAVEVGGELVVEAPQGFAAPAGTELDVVATVAPNLIDGRFTRATLPPPIGGRFLRVHYSPRAAQLLPSVNVGGLDANVYPGDLVMKRLVNETPWRWVGYYLHTPPYHPDKSWLGHHEFLGVECNLGVAVLYVGRQVPAHVLTRQTGREDGQDAVAKTAAEGFQAGSWIYLDVEWTAGGITEEKALYVEGWATEVLRLGTYSPAVYCPAQDVAPLFPRLMGAFRAAGRVDRPRFWVATLSRTFDIALPPARSGIPEATVWQQQFNAVERGPDGTPRRTPDGKPWMVDRDVSVLADPSAP